MTQQMKKLSLLITALLIGFSSFGQTYFPSTPAGTSPLTTLSWRYKAVTPDSLNKLYLYWNGKYNEMLTKTQANLLYTPIGGGFLTLAPPNQVVAQVPNFNNGVRIGTDTVSEPSANVSLYIKTPVNTTNTARGIRVENHFNGSYGATGISAYEYIDGNTNRSHQNNFQSFVYKTGTARVQYASNFYATRILSNSNIGQYYGYYYNPGTGAPDTSYSAFLLGDPVFTNAKIAVSDDILNNTSITSPLYVYKPMTMASGSIATSQSAIMSNNTAANGIGGTLALGGKTGLASSPYTFAFLKGSPANAGVNYGGQYGVWVTSDGANAGETNGNNYERFHISPNGNMGNGKINPTTLFHLASESNPVITLQTASGGNYINGNRSNGTLLSPTAVSGGANLMVMAGAGYGTTGFRTGGFVSVNAAGTYTDSSSPGYISLATTPSGSTTPTEVIRVSETQTVNLPLLSASQYVKTSSGKDLTTVSTIPQADVTNLVSDLAGKEPTITTLSVAKGGTGQTSYTNGQLLIGNTTGNTLTKATLTGTSSQVSVTNGAGSITLGLPAFITPTIGTTGRVGFVAANTGGSYYAAGENDLGTGLTGTTVPAYSMVVGTSTAKNVIVMSNNVPRNYTDGTSGHFLPFVTNAYDLGTASLNWRNVYATTYNGAGTNLTGTGASFTSGNSTKWNTESYTASLATSPLYFMGYDNAATSWKPVALSAVKTTLGYYTSGDAMTLGNGSTATTQIAGDNSNKVATTAQTLLEIAALKAANNTWGGANVFTSSISTPVLYLTTGGVYASPITSANSAARTYLMPDESGTVDIGYKKRLTGSGTGAATTISIAHGLSGVTSASIALVQPINAASAGVSYVTTDATNVNIVYTVAPILGSGNLSYNVSIKP